MIKTLTKDQEAKISVYLKKYLSLGHRTHTTDKVKAEKAIEFFYKVMGKSKPKYIIYLDSPMACQLACNLIKNTKFDTTQLESQLYSQLRSQLRSQLDSQLDSQLESQLYSQLYSQLDSQLGSQLNSQLDSQLGSQLNSQLDSQLESQLYSQLESQLYSQLGSQLDSQLYSQLYSQLGSQLYSQLRSQLGSQLDSQLYSQLYSQLESQLDSQLRSQLGSQLDSQLYSQKLEYFYPAYSANLWSWGNYYGFYDYVLNELVPDKVPYFSLFKEFLGNFKEVHYFYPFPEICFVADFPSHINLDSTNRLHAERSYALQYRDGFGFCSFNGVRVPDSVGLKAAHEVDTGEVLALTNTEQRAAAMRYVGLARFMDSLGATEIHKYKDYKLYYLNVENQKIGPYLYMKCPSTGREFLEGCGDATKYENVDPTIVTCQQALEWRAKQASKQLMKKYNQKWLYQA